ncbi:hypothetical protein BaRGS_00027982, partial [Batillaria attramentaria]
PKPKYDPDIKNPCWWANYTNDLSQWMHRRRNRNDLLRPRVNGSRVLKCLPYAHIICCSKSGTTDLFVRLSVHPDYVKTGYKGKEHLYWSWHKYGLNYKGRKKRTSPIAGYVNSFNPVADRLLMSKDSRSRLITVDASPPDMWDFRGWIWLPQNRNLSEPQVLTPHIMQHLYRDPKFLVLMRDPVERVYTAYLFHRMGNNSFDFHQDVMKSIALFNRCLTTRPSRRQCYFDTNLLGEMKVEIPFMCYAVYIKEWLDVFPRKHFMFMKTERYSQEMESHLFKIFDFLNMSRPSSALFQQMLAFPKSYHTKVKDKAGPMLPETRAVLRKYAESCNQELADLLHDDAYLWKDELPPRSEGSQMVHNVISGHKSSANLPLASS